MKNYMVTHTFKSAEMKKKFTDTVASMKMEDIIKSMKSDNAACQMTWNTPGDTMEMYCWSVSYTHLTLPTIYSV